MTEYARAGKAAQLSAQLSGGDIEVWIHPVGIDPPATQGAREKNATDEPKRPRHEPPPSGDPEGKGEDRRGSSDRAQCDPAWDCHVTSDALVGSSSGLGRKWVVTHAGGFSGYAAGVP